MELEAVRIEAAKQLLKRGKSIKAVAEELGYRSTDRFGAAFRDQIGRGPTHWQRECGFQTESELRLAKAEAIEVRQSRLYLWTQS
jgi:AraC-like DNA-binding protein